MSGIHSAPRPARRRPRGLRTRALATGVALLTAAPLAVTSWSPAAADHEPGHAAPVGQGFNLNASDLRFVLKQIKIAEQHADTLSADNPCGTMRGAGADQIPAGEVGDTLPWGLRLIDGTCNNLVAGKVTVGAADQDFPRLVPKSHIGAESRDPSAPATSYTQTSGTVFDSRPRIISNLIVDQTAGNPAAVDAAADTDEIDSGPPVPEPGSDSFFIPNTAPDVGLSAPYNSWFTLFGQFFDHGLDLVNKGGNGSVFMPLKPDDPLYVPGSPTNFMILTRATHDGNHEANNQTSPWVDQSQTYTSHPSHQVFLRAYADDDPDLAVGQLRTTGRLITGPGDGMATWADVKAQADELLGIALTDADALSIPLLATDPYGRFDRGPNGFPQVVTATGLVEGDPTANNGTGITLPANTARTGHAFLDDIAHTAAPNAGLSPDADETLGLRRCDPRTDPTEPLTPTGCDKWYDDEMLDAHFIAGDGRVNENIGLTSVHHVFHSEHNRLVGDIDTKISTLLTAEEQADWRSSRYAASNGSYDYGERLFQAARFVTEMEYQHLAFEEFIRKVQPLVNPFGEGGTGYNTAINPAIKAEFAHAVYRFGHSMLNESVDRVRANGTSDNISLLDAFLNPPSFMAGGRTPEQAAGDVVRGMTRQVGNELDEFVTGALRNRLLGLPLDLATLNIARARDTGIPTLNAARRSFYAASNNSSLAPHESWSDFRFSLKHPKSLTNFIAAYGTHPTITGTVAERRAAAKAIADPASGQVRPRDAVDFLAGTDYDETADNTPAVPAGPGPDGLPGTDCGTPTASPECADNTAAVPAGPGPDGIMDNDPATDWKNVDGRTVTGVDAIDLWVGGLAEKQHVFGGLLGPTFNYVFEAQMEDLQFGDRFYYLARTAGLNMLTQLEGNSFAELIQRNTDVSGLPADSFSTPGLTFDLSKLGTSGPLLDDPETPYNEADLREDGITGPVLERRPDGTVRYSGTEHVVFNGTAGNNRIWASEGDDTIRGNDGNDWVQGGDGNDNHVGGLGDDILLDSNGDDTIKGGDGNDLLSSGQGFGGDLLQGGRDNDVILHGNDMAESFGGPGDDWVLGGAGDDTVFGDDGDDWIESGATITGTGGGAFNLLQGDNGAPFQDDQNEPGHDVLMGYGGETDNDAEGGDDVMLNGPGIQRNEGMLGFDYATHDGDLSAADSDMALTGLLPPSVETNKDRFDLVEALSGWNLNDTLRGDDRDATDMVGHELTAAGVARVAGLGGVLGGATTFTGGNILMGGAGADLIEGRGGNDVIDGDAQLNVRIGIRSGVSDPTTEIGSVEKLADVTARVNDGTVNPGQLRIVREILTPADAASADIAVFSGPRADYDFAEVGTALTVRHTRGTQVDGTDTLRNVERLRFGGSAAPADQDVLVSSVTENSAPTGAVTLSSTTPAQGQALTATTTTIADADQLGPITVTWQRATAAAPGTWVDIAGATGPTYTPVAADVGSTLRAVATFTDGKGNVERVISAASSAVAEVALAAPGAPTIGTATAGNASATVSWTAPANTGGSPITAYRIQRITGGNATGGGLTVAATTDPAVIPGGALDNSAVVTGLTNGTDYRFTVTAVTDVGVSLPSARSSRVRPLATIAPPAGPDTTAPAVTSTSPVNNARNVNRTRNITATFNEAVTGVSGATFTLRVTGATADLAAEVRYDDATRVASLNPVADLLRNTSYTATLTQGITDTAAAKNRLLQTSWTFRTN